MPPTLRIPLLLQPHVHLPHEDSLLLLTSTLGASANWLIVRFLCQALSNLDSSGDGGGTGTNVVLVSWMRDYEFWKQEARKAGGLDLEKFMRDGRLAVVDGMSGLFVDAQDTRGTRGQVTTSLQPVRPSGVLPVRGAMSAGPAPARGPPAAVPRSQTALPSETATPTNKPVTTGLHTLQSIDLAHLKSTILEAVHQLHTFPTASRRKTLLILDNLDILLATSPHPAATLTGLTSLILTLHTQIPYLLIHVQSDTPLITLSTPAQPIEHAQHNFLVKLAHMSTRILSVRVLDTGVARDVSGVLRVTENRERLGGVGLLPGENEQSEKSGGEVLYKVGADGSVRVFERGTGGDV